ncbi:RNA polymerase sigma factor [Roseivirga sp.]|uniref:RNA polymerase sigma factor n=1 Tax=Roseivirga sp. TaxID=1964215 RepID=UPI003B5180A5
MEEKVLLQEFKQPSTKERAFRGLVAAYQERIYWHVRKIVIAHDDADDVTQEVFIKIYKNLDDFREDSQLFTWIYRIATNEALNHLKKMKRRSAVSMDDVHGELENHLTQGALVSGDEIQMKLQKALLKLPEKQRLVFNMKYFDDLKYDEISEITGTSVGALKASFHLAVKKIEEDLSED